MENQIEIVRKETLLSVKNGTLYLEAIEDRFSRSKKFIAKITPYRGDIRAERLEILDAEIKQVLWTLYTNHTCFASWITKDNNEYLICAEDLCGGQTVINVTNNSISSFTFNNPSGWIWSSHHLSPEENLLAVVGCGWGTPTWVKVYDFNVPMDLPLHEVYDGNDDVYEFIEWLDNDTYKVRLMSKEEKIIKMNLNL
jgi:hypothetical protein